MKAIYEIDREQMKQIQVEKTKFHFDVNDKVLKIINILLVLLVILYVVIVLVLRDFLLGFTGLFLTSLLLWLISPKATIHRAVKIVDRLYHKFKMDKMIVEIDFHDKGYHAINKVGPKTIKGSILYNEIYWVQLNTKVDCLIISTGKMVSSYFKSKPRVIYLGELEDSEKTRIIESFKKYSKHFFVDTRSTNEKKSLNLWQNIKKYKLLLFTIIGFLTLIALTNTGFFGTHILGINSYDINQLAESYDYYVVNEDNTHLLALNYKEGTESLYLNSYFFSEHSNRLLASREM
ncbi:MAG: hypothetical protein ACNA7U_03745, partial [Candidatus Izemoplasmataceae bacterium]